MRHIWLVFCVALLSGATAYRPGLAAETQRDSPSQQRNRQRVAQYTEGMSAARKVLADKPADQWTAKELETYLIEAYWVICGAIQWYVDDTNSLPDSIASLAQTDYIPVWPDNPLCGWMPMRVLAIEDGYAPGELVLQICPPEYYSGLAHPKPKSFVLGVYGTDAQSELPGDYDLGHNGAWALRPKGVLILGGAYYETAASLRKKWARMKQQQKDEDIQN